MMNNNLELCVWGKEKIWSHFERKIIASVYIIAWCECGSGLFLLRRFTAFFPPELRIILLRSNNNTNNKNNRTSAYGAASHRRRQHHHTALISSCVLSRTNESRRRPYTPSTRINQSKKCSQKKKVIFLFFSFSCFSDTGWRRLYLYTIQTDRAVWSNKNKKQVQDGTYPNWDPWMREKKIGRETQKEKLVQQLRGVVGESVSMTWWWNQDVCAVAAVANVGMTMISASFFHLFSHAVNLQRRWGGPAWVAACCCCCGSRPRERYIPVHTEEKILKKEKMSGRDVMFNHFSRKWNVRTTTANRAPFYAAVI